MAVRVRSTLETILPKVKDQVVKSADTELSQVFVSLQTDEEIATHPPSDRFFVLTPDVYPVDVGALAGGGKYTLLFEGTLQLAYWVRYSTDQAYRNDRYLLDPEDGVLRVWTNVLAGFTNPMFDPLNGDGNYLMAEPMRLARAGFRFRRRRVVVGWGKIHSLWELRWHQDVGSVV